MQLNKDYPGLLKELTPAKTVRWRVRVLSDKKRRITLAVAPDHEDFEHHYEAARNGRKLEAKAPKNIKQGTLDSLCEAYRNALPRMVTAKNIQESTMDSRVRGLKQACDVKYKGRRMGALQVDLPKEAFTHIMDSFLERTGAAETCLKALKAAYKWGEDRGFAKVSDVHKVPTPHTGKGGAKAWSSEDEAKFLATHGRGTMARRWFYLSKNTAGRIEDIALLGPENIKLKNGRAYLGWQPKKKGSKYVQVPLMPELADELDLGVWHPGAFILTNRGDPFGSKDSLGNRIAKWVVQAELTRDVEVVNQKTGKKEIEKRAALSQHGVRKATAHELALSGASVYEIAARLSHSDFKSSAPYVQDVDRDRLVQSGFDRVEQARLSQGVPHPKNRGTQERLTSSKTTENEEKWQPVGLYQFPAKTMR